jgi:hypothetical protein
MRTNGRFEQKLPVTDAFLPMDASDFFSVGAGASTLTLNAKGDVSFNMAASLAGKWICSLTGLIFRTGQAPFLQEQFGTAAGVAGPTTVANTSDPDAGIGPPPQTGQLSIIPQTGFFPKGVKIVDITMHYQITTNPLALHTVGLSKTVKPVSGTPAALVVTDIIANAANGLATAANANPQSTKVLVASPVFNVTDLSELIIELDATTPAGGTYRMYGATVHLQYNYN